MKALGTHSRYSLFLTVRRCFPVRCHLALFTVEQQHVPSCYLAGSCGLCFEVQCYNSIFDDDNGLQLDRSDACYDETASVVLRNVDSCPS